jgi:polyhydroxyalkanoate synthesis regulator phasin
MLPEETEKKLSEYGFDVSALTDAIKSEEVVNVDVPQLYKEKGLSNDDMTVFGKNRFEEGKQAMSEIMAKSYKEKYGVELEGKNLDNVVEAIKDKYSKPSDNTELENSFKELQNRYSQLEGDFSNKQKEFESELFKREIRGKLNSAMPKDTTIDKSDIIDLYLLKHTIDGDGVKVNGEIQKDNLLSPLSPEDHFKTWIDSSNYVKRGGMGGEGSKGGSSVGKFNSFDDFMEYAENNHSVQWANSEEGQRFLNENKSKNFSF